MRHKILGVLLACLLLFIHCGTKLNTTKVRGVIKDTFGLTKEDPLEILEVFMESENRALVKFKLYTFEYSIKMKKFVDKGWQIVEGQDPDDLKWYPLTKQGIEGLKKFFKAVREKAREFKD